MMNGGKPVDGDDEQKEESDAVISVKAVSYDMTSVSAGLTKEKVRELAAELKKTLESGDDIFEEEAA